MTTGRTVATHDGRVERRTTRAHKRNANLNPRKLYDDSKDTGIERRRARPYARPK